MLIESRLAFVDVETTGASADQGLITEIAIVSVDWPADDCGPPYACSWSSLVNPGRRIPPAIRYLTGISDQMLVDAPSFADLADDILARLDARLFIAHHARFDYGFIKAEMQRAGRAFQARPLCTVRLSRALHPDRSPHTLDALIARHRLPVTERHRALGDAAVLWAFIRRMALDHGAQALTQAAQRLLRRPSLPSHLALDSLDTVPDAPGIYAFFGLNEQPLYIGKSRHIRERVGSHFSADHASARGLRLASEVRRLCWQQTAGEFGALLAEIGAIERLMPAHNRALRRNHKAVLLEIGTQAPWLRWHKAGALEPAAMAGLYGPFSSRQAARNRLLAAVREHGLCARVLGLERGQPQAPCFGRQLGQCHGACVGHEPVPALIARLHEALAPHRVPGWPADTGLLVMESDPARGQRQAHLFHHWSWLGSADAPGGHAGEPPDACGAAHLAPWAPQPAAIDQRVIQLLRAWVEPLPPVGAEAGLPRLAGVQALADVLSDPAPGRPGDWHEPAGPRHAGGGLQVRWVALDTPV
ncbi:MAG: exonuclease domain-containing protein [Burkholderiaceae bacterium]